MQARILPYRDTWPIIAEDAFVAPGATVIGDVVIGARTNIWFGCVVRGDVHEIRIGEGVNIQDGTVVHVSYRFAGTYVGDNVTIGHMALIHACTIEADAFIGMHATVMDKAVVESGAMVAADAVVGPGKRIPSGQLWAGNPAAYKRDVNDRDRFYMTFIPPHYVELGQEYRETVKRLRPREAAKVQLMKDHLAPRPADREHQG